MNKVISYCNTMKILNLIVHWLVMENQVRQIDLASQIPCNDNNDRRTQASVCKKKKLRHLSVLLISLQGQENNHCRIQILYQTCMMFRCEYYTMRTQKNMVEEYHIWIFQAVSFILYKCDCVSLWAFFCCCCVCTRYTSSLQVKASMTKEAICNTYTCLNDGL